MDRDVSFPETSSSWSSCPLSFHADLPRLALSCDPRRTDEIFLLVRGEMAHTEVNHKTTRRDIRGCVSQSTRVSSSLRLTESGGSSASAFGGAGGVSSSSAASGAAGVSAASSSSTGVVVPMEPPSSSAARTTASSCGTSGTPLATASGAAAGGGSGGSGGGGAADAVEAASWSAVLRFAKEAWRARFFASFAARACVAAAWTRRITSAMTKSTQYETKSVARRMTPKLSADVKKVNRIAAPRGIASPSSSKMIDCRSAGSGMRKAARTSPRPTTGDTVLEDLRSWLISS
mmetsp:Transcript_15252/g.61321  ORF Transcript_15252/g.61321 Transcript_15252/m.61321 type:complete len:290 (-) Transcript_15252:1426-2295(-)